MSNEKKAVVPAEVLAISKSIQERITLNKEGSFDLDTNDYTEMLEEHLPEGQTLKDLKAFQSFNKNFTAGVVDAIGVTSMAAFEDDAELQHTNITVPLGSSRIAADFYRERELRAPNLGTFTRKNTFTVKEKSGRNGPLEQVKKKFIEIS